MPMDERTLMALNKHRRKFMRFHADRHAPNIRIEGAGEDDDGWYATVDDKSGTCDGQADEWGTALGEGVAIRTKQYLPHCRRHLAPPHCLSLFR